MRKLDNKIRMSAKKNILPELSLLANNYVRVVSVIQEQ